jgi:hypothetical protein
MFAFQVEEEDFILHEGEGHQVTSIDDAGDHLNFDTRDLDGEVSEVPPIGPFDTVHVITSFED